MAMNPANLKSEILAAIQVKIATVFPASVAGLATYHDALAEGIALAVVAHLVANAVVQPTLLIAPGGMVPAPVTGQGRIV